MILIQEVRLMKASRKPRASGDDPNLRECVKTMTR